MIINTRWRHQRPVFWIWSFLPWTFPGLGSTEPRVLHFGVRPCLRNVSTLLSFETSYTTPGRPLNYLSVLLLEVIKINFGQSSPTSIHSPAVTLVKKSRLGLPCLKFLKLSKIGGTEVYFALDYLTHLLGM